MTITLGSFSCAVLTAQPFGYDGEARQGLTARAFRVSGLLTPAQWQALINEYNTWRNARINDIDTLKSKVIGTTINLTISKPNGLSITSLPCWFDQAPQGQQAGTYISAEAVLVDAAQALAVLLRQQELQNERSIAEAEDVDCAVIAANLQKQKDETDCELTALAGGLADDFAEQAIARSKIDAVSKATASAAATTDLAAIKAAEASVELLERQAEITGRASTANALAAAELQLQEQSAMARAAAYSGGAARLAAIKGAEYDQGLAQLTADRTALTTGTRLEQLKTARALQAVYEKYISEDLPNLGTLSFGSCTVTLTSPPETRQDGPQVAMTATGTSYVTGPRVAHKVRRVQGYISSGSYADLLTWFDTTINAVPSAGTWFPVDPPTAEAEPFLIGGVKSTRYNVSLTVLEIR